MATDRILLTKSSVTTSIERAISGNEDPKDTMLRIGAGIRAIAHPLDTSKAVSLRQVSQRQYACSLSALLNIKVGNFKQALWDIYDIAADNEDEVIPENIAALLSLISDFADRIYSS